MISNRALIAVVLGVAAGTAAAEVTAPVLQPGDRWTYRVVDYFNHREIGRETRTVVAASTEGIRIDAERSDGRGGRWWQFSAPGVLATGALGDSLFEVRLEPGLELLPFPLAEGRRWSQTVLRRSPHDAERRPVRLQGKVLGWETVKVPAGEFRALRIERVILLGDGDSFRGETRRTEYEWYVPEIAAPVRIQTFDEYHFYRERVLAPYAFGDWRIYELVSYARR